MELAKIVEEFDLTIVLTARCGIQLHVKEVWERVNAIGSLTTWQSFGDNVRNIVTDAYDGLLDISHIECYPLVKQMQDYIIKNPKYVGMLPRRVSIGISGNEQNVASFFANDIYFALAKKDDHYGFNVYMGGKNTETAQDADIFLKEEDVFAFYKAFLETFYNHGSRYSRSKTRLFYFIEEHGMAKLKELIEGYFGKAFESAGELVLQKGEFKEFRELRDGSYAYCYETNFSKLDAKEMMQIAEFAKENAKEIRFGMDQNIHIIGLKEPKVPFPPAAKSSTVVACAGNLCPYAVWSIKAETKYLPLDLIEKHSIYVGFSGCAKGCGRHRHTDIGLIGLKTNNFGDVEGGCRIFIGAEHTYGKSVGRELFSMVPFPFLNETVTLIIELYLKSGFKNFEEYSKEVLRYYSNRFLALWHIANLERHTQIPLPKPSKELSFEEERELLLETFKDFELVEDDFFKTLSHKAKELWTVEGKDPKYKPPIKRVVHR
ncbi:Ferredoxin--nitrite reductase [hydrothermal vent metagenome]|uniref:Ferredoxin--nitrite reductase n=1 Tax=hydrothermal vent metagenome TaxID=652676 RepID=A0A1W1C5Y7_9ZZZZ